MLAVLNYDIICICVLIIDIQEPESYQNENNRMTYNLNVLLVTFIQQSQQ